MIKVYIVDGVEYNVSPDREEQFLKDFPGAQLVEEENVEKTEPVAETTAPAAGRIDPTSTLSTGSQLEDGSLGSQDPAKGVFEQIFGKDIERQETYEEREARQELELQNKRQQVLNERGIDPNTGNPKELSSGEKMLNSFGNMVDQIQQFIPNLVISSNKFYRTIFGDETVDAFVANKSIPKFFKEGLSEEDLDEAIQQQQLQEAEMKETGQIVEGFKEGDIGEIAAGIVNGVTSIGSSLAINYVTGGGGLIPDMIGRSYINYNDALAKEKDKTLSDLIKDKEDGVLVPATIGTISGILERLPLKGANKAAMNFAVKAGANKTLSSVLISGSQEGITELTQTGLEAVNEAAAKGEDKSEAFFNAIGSQEGLESFLQGFVGGGVIGGKTRNILADKKDLLKASSVLKSKEISDDIDKNLNELAELREQEKLSKDKQVKNSIRKQIKEKENIIRDAQLEHNKILNNMTETEIYDASKISDNIDKINNDIDNINAKFDNGLISESERDLVLEGLELDFQKNQDKLLKIKEDSIIRADEKIEKQTQTVKDDAAKLRKEGVKIEVKEFENTKETEEYILSKDKRKTKKSKIIAESADGTIYQNADGSQEIIINKEVARKTGAVNVAAHEFLHGVLYKTLKDNPDTAINLGQALAKEINKIDISKVKNSTFLRRLQLYKDKPAETRAEEVIALFADAVATGDIKYNENVFTKLGNVIRRILERFGVKKKFDTGKDVFNFIKDYNADISRGGVRQSIIQGAKEGFKGKLVTEPTGQSTATEKESRSNINSLLESYKGNKRTMIEQGFTKTPAGEETFIPFESEFGQSIGGLVESITKRIYDPIPEDLKKGQTRAEFRNDLVSEAATVIDREYDASKQDLGTFITNRLNLRANRIQKDLGVKQNIEADVTEAKNITTEAVTPEVQQIKKIAERLGVSDNIIDKAKKALDIAILNAQNKLKGTEKLSGKKRIAIRDKAINSIIDGKLYRDIQNEFGRNTSTSKSFTDYLNNNFEALRDAALKHINFQKGTGAALNWNTKAPSKQEFIDYYLAEGEKKSTRSDRKRKLAKAVGLEMSEQTRKDYIENNPVEAEKFTKETGIPLASLSFVNEFVQENNIPDKDTYDLNLSLDEKTFKENLAKYIKDIQEIINLYNSGKLINKSMVQGFFAAQKPKKGTPEKKLFDYAIKKLKKIKYGKGDEKIEGISLYSKEKVSNFIKRAFTAIGEGDVKGTDRILGIFKKDAFKDLIRAYNIRNSQQGLQFWTKANEIFQDKENKRLATAFAYLTSSSFVERSHPHSVMAEFTFIEKGIKGQKTIIEHAVPSNYAAKILSNALFDSPESFLKTFKNVKSQYKQGILKKSTDKIINQFSKLDMPDVDGRAYDINKDSYIVRYTSAVPNIKDQLIWIAGGTNDFDVKTPAEQNKLSKSLSTDFNRILEEVKGVPTRERFSEARANILGKKKNPFKFFVPYSAEDYMGLIYPTLGKGKIGDKNLEWYKKNIINPYAKGIRDFESDKQLALKSWEELKAQIKNTPAKLNKEAINDFTNENAIRIYLWAKQGVDFNDIGLSKKEVAAINRYVKSKPELKDFATQIQSLTPDGYPEPTGTDWLAGTITTDLVNYTNTVSRAKYLKEWQNNVDIVYSKDNMNKLKAIYGENYTDALQDMLYRMKTGRNRPSGGNKLTNQYLNWVNDSVGTIMFFNMRSAMLQTISSVNYLNWTDNNPINVAKTAANQKQFWSDFSEIFNSDFLKSRRSGLKTDVNADEIARSAETSKNKFRAGLSALLKKGFLPTQMADSFAISFGGASFYRNRINTYLKQGLNEKAAKEKAFLDFKEITEESQQSSRPDRVSMQQASPLGRVILAFANTPMQYTRLTKKAALDLINNRGDWKTNLSKLAYYGAVQNIIFTALQSAMFAMLFSDTDDDEEKEKIGRIGNGIADTLLRGSGVAGAAVATAKNMVLEAIRQYESGRPNYEKVANQITTLSPPINSKLRKLQSAGRAFTYKQNLEKMREEGPLSIDNPAYMAAAEVLSATANIPLDRALRKLENLRASVDSDTEMWQRISLMLGYSKWDVGIIQEERKQKNIDNGLRRYFEKQSKIRPNKKRKDPASTLGGSTRRSSKSRDKASTLNKGLPNGVLGRANNDGTIEIKSGLPKAKEKKVIAHEKQHMRDMKAGKLNYDDNFVYWNSSKYKRTNDNKIVYNGKKFPEGHSKLPWEAVANKAERKVS